MYEKYFPVVQGKIRAEKEEFTPKSTLRVLSV